MNFIYIFRIPGTRHTIAARNRLMRKITQNDINEQEKLISGRCSAIPDDNGEKVERLNEQNTRMVNIKIVLPTTEVVPGSCDKEDGYKWQKRNLYACSLFFVTLTMC